jgi:hypothetical protein
LPINDTILNPSFPPEYIISKSNIIDFQKKFECAAFSSAYVLRHFDIPANGFDIYKNYPYKLLNGIIAPKGILHFFNNRNFIIKYYRGNISTLKYRLSLGTPIIIFIKVFQNKNYLHFVPIIGYDTTNFYLADSLPFLANCNNEKYNRIINISELQHLWNISIPYNKNTYFTIEKNSPLAIHGSRLRRKEWTII